MGRAARLVGLVVAVSSAACGDDAAIEYVSTRYDAAVEDGGADGAVVDFDAALGMDAASPPAMDASMDAAPMASMDASMDAAMDAAGRDGSGDVGDAMASADASGLDAAGADAAASGMDGGAEDAAGMELDAGFEVDAGLDAGADAAPRGCYDPNPGGTPECLVDEDCRLVDNCCDCMPLPVDEPARFCNPRVTCLISRCAAIAIDEGDVACVAGHCVFGTMACGEPVSCGDPDPRCTAQRVPEVAGGCYTGRCLEPELCGSVGSCDQCMINQVCVSDETDGTLHCVPTPPGCSADQSCGCMGANACGNLDCCDDPAGLICYDEPNP